MPRNIETIVVHHSASDKSTHIDQIRSWHVARGFVDVGYHMVVRGMGSGIFESMPGRDLDRQGAHTIGHNRASLGICLCGDYEIDRPSPGMIEVASQIIAEWCWEYGIDVNSIYGHGELKATACPGKNLNIDRIKYNVAKLLNSKEKARARIQ